MYISVFLYLSHTEVSPYLIRPRHFCKPYRISYLSISHLLVFANITITVTRFSGELFFVICKENDASFCLFNAFEFAVAELTIKWYWFFIQKINMICYNNLLNTA